MMATKKSPYSEMYLVSPAIYQRMLKCLDRSDVNIVENLNQPITIEEWRKVVNQEKKTSLLSFFHTTTTQCINTAYKVKF